MLALARIEGCVVGRNRLVHRFASLVLIPHPTPFLHPRGLTGFLLLALVSAVWTARRAGAHYDEARDSLAPAARHQALTSKFAAERNMYLCAFAFTTFVALIRIQGILRKQVELKRELAALKSGSTATASDKGSSIKKD